jgi:hypothetical protein
VFESVSALRRIESEVFSGCGSLCSIDLPEGIESLARDWDLKSSFEMVRFESVKCIKRMIERGSFGVRNDIEIVVRQRNCETEEDFALPDGRIVKSSSKSDQVPAMQIIHYKEDSIQDMSFD